MFNMSNRHKGMFNMSYRHKCMIPSPCHTLSALAGSLLEKVTAVTSNLNLRHYRGDLARGLPCICFELPCAVITGKGDSSCSDTDRYTAVTSREHLKCQWASPSAKLASQSISPHNLLSWSFNIIDLWTDTAKKITVDSLSSGITRKNMLTSRCLDTLHPL